MAGGMAVYKQAMYNFVRDKPVHVFLGGAVVVAGAREYQKNSVYNYWFGRIHLDRMVARGKI
jgi:hypothetical protein